MKNYIIYDISNNKELTKVSFKYNDGFRNLQLQDGIIWLPYQQGTNPDPYILYNNMSESERISCYRTIVREAITFKREEKEREGIPYQFPDKPGTIQTGSDIDFRNLNSLMSIAILQNSMGETRPIFSFRDQENQDHNLTPLQMIQMCVYATQYISGLYQKSWAKKTEISNINTVKGLIDYNINTGW